MANSDELLAGLYRQYHENQQIFRMPETDSVSVHEQGRTRDPPDPTTFVRPRIISYTDGTTVVLERTPTHLPKAHCDRVTIKTAQGTYVLNDMTSASVLFIDGGYGFECGVEPRGDKPTDYFIYYGSFELERKNGLYSLLHEFGHITVRRGRRYRSIAHFENAVWDEADKLAAEMGVVLFDNEKEQCLYRDICVRTYDLCDGGGIAYRSVVRGIHLNRFGREVIFGLLEAAKQGLPLEAICTTLLSKTKQGPET